LTSDVESETPNYKGEGGLCQAQLRKNEAHVPSQACRNLIGGPIDPLKQERHN
jgi:hypothetical protein